MTINAELEAKILRYYHAEKWRMGTIARQLGMHHKTVKRVLLKAGIPHEMISDRKAMITPFLPFLKATLEKFPTLSASRLFEMVRARGYPGQPDHFRHTVACYRPRKSQEAYLRLRTLPGEQGQCDWGSFSKIIIGRAERNLSAFVMTLSYSRKLFLQFYLSQCLENFLRGHEAAFSFFSGVPRVVLTDNLKACVLEREGSAIRFHPTMLEFSGHYRFEPRPCAVARGNEKGRVERAISYIRKNFFAGRQYSSLEDLNQQALAWCEGIASDRPCPEDTSRTVREVFEEEKPRLLDLPAHPFPTEEKVVVSIGKTPYARFDLNDYSVPHEHVRRTVTVLATLDTVKIVDGHKVIARHARSFDKGQQIEQAEHIKALASWKRASRENRGLDYLHHAAPSANTFLKAAATKNTPLKAVVKQLTELLEDYGAADFDDALKEALKLDSPHPNTVRHCLNRKRDEAKRLPPVKLDLPKDQRIRECVVRVHSLDTYDQINHHEENENA